MRESEGVSVPTVQVTDSVTLGPLQETPESPVFPRLSKELRTETGSRTDLDSTYAYSTNLDVVGRKLVHRRLFPDFRSCTSLWFTFTPDSDPQTTPSNPETS